MAESSFGRRVPFMFLEDIMSKWADSYGDRGMTALAYGMNEDFSRVLQKQASLPASRAPPIFLVARCACPGLTHLPQMDVFLRQAEPSLDRLSRVSGEIEEARQVMVENIDRCLP